MKMNKNMGTADRTIRITAAVVIGVLILTGRIHGLLGTILGLFAVIFLITSTLAWCPAYLPFGISTRKQPPGSTAA